MASTFTTVELLSSKTVIESSIAMGGLLSPAIPIPGKMDTKKITEQKRDSIRRLRQIFIFGLLLARSYTRMVNLGIL